ncbi:MAG TPA: NAD(P)/FAD-dependent oxidoreductase [Candidatus Sulfotelmatobacter sp.]|nr:NAD(P)/FAD-dependent oxidoreductase [Candidatus Sulfotelmatobacter sp.]
MTGTSQSANRRATVVGAGPNGLAAAIVLAQAGLRVDVFEAEPCAGGAARTLELTLSGFRHDFGSAVHPLAAGSPFFSTLPLASYGLEWIHSPSTLAHPLDDGTAVLLDRDFALAKDSFGRDANSWRRLMEPFARNWPTLATEVLAPIHILTRHPLLLARFGLAALPPANTVASFCFKQTRTKALFAGLAAHSFLGLNEPLSAAFAVLLGAAAHAVGWPVPRGGAQSIANVLTAHLESLGGRVHVSSKIERLSDVADVTLCDITPRQLLRISDTDLSAAFRAKLEKFRYGTGVFKVDYALAGPIPWKAKDCLRAATVHIGGSAEEISAAESSVRDGKIADRPFVLLAQPSLFDATRAPEGKHTAWAYCHIPNGSTVDMLDKIENQIERFAPGFRDCVLARRVFSPAALESMDANLVGGDINGGAMDVGQFLFRPTMRHYATSAPNIYLCSSSTPPGGAVHGMCGYHAAKLALSRLR